ncbi:hypothetical protein D0511_06810 [Pseudoalteromonas piscicida]|uniref:Uncharacterized protein n=1 Tax=Pseudoalteromonas piscicida TaxID=43662 RepID=A0AAD0W384_PSEO7|nr:hypothetical protein D0511_06810 [Pseudoalteromonas piscicida]
MIYRGFMQVKLKWFKGIVVPSLSENVLKINDFLLFIYSFFGEACSKLMFCLEWPIKSKY